MFYSWSTLKTQSLTNKKFALCRKSLAPFVPVTRETDIIGWYVHDHILGVIATEISKASSARKLRSKMSQKIRAAFLESLGPTKASQISVSFHFFPEERLRDGDFNDSANNALWPPIHPQKVFTQIGSAASSEPWTSG